MELMITMGHAFRDKLEAALKEIGAEKIAADYTEGSTSWTVVAVFPDNLTQRDVRRILREKTLASWIDIKPAGER